MLKNKVTLVNRLMWLTACGPISTWEVVTAFKGTMRCPSSLLMYSFPKSCGSERLSSATSKITWYWSVLFLIR